MTFVEFSSATDAVNGAINIHQNFKKANAQNPDTFQMNLRIGIHMGEVYEKNNDFYYCGTIGCNRIPFGDAVELVFQCPTCNTPLSHCENGKIVENLSKKVEQLRKELGE